MKNLVKSCLFTLASIMVEHVIAAEATPIPAQSRGTINFNGAIIDAPCSIDPKSGNQTVQMGQISSSVLELKKSGPLRPFEIHLEGCTLDTAKSATVTFNGIADNDDNTYLATNGYAKGAAISMVNQNDGSQVVLGKPTNIQALVSGDNRLKFAAQIVSNVKTGTNAVAGEFSATTDFLISYQ